MTPEANERGILFGGPTGGVAAGGIVYNGSAAPNGLQLRTNGSDTRVVLTSAGDVGIGTTSPQARLHVAGTAGTDGIMFPDGSVQVSAVRMLSADGTFDYPSINPHGPTFVSIFVPGATVGSAVFASPDVELPPPLLQACAFVEPNSRVRIVVLNSGETTFDPPPNTWHIRVFE